jgi:hypothetical protein
MTHRTSQHALEVRAREVRVVNCGDYIWARFWAASGSSNLLFHAFPDGNPRFGKPLDETA